MKTISASTGRLFLTAAFSLLMLSSAFAWDQRDMNATIDASNYTVNRGCSGTVLTGWAKEPMYAILTAAHCVTDQYEDVEIEDINDQTGEIKKKKVRRKIEGSVTRNFYTGPEITSTLTMPTTLLAVDKDQDLALIQVKKPVMFADPRTKIACTDPQRGDTVYAVGNPMGLYASVTKGIVSSIQRTNSDIGVGYPPDRKLLQISPGIVGGNSGGAAYNDRGELVGVNVMAHRFNEVLGFAVPVQVIRKFLTDKGYGELVACDQNG